ncbi:hypothetical protein DZF79_28630 [Vibrio parahaemolyticus]|nr:hypothetical protein [Vibrio parahaemolyticus]
MSKEVTASTIIETLTNNLQESTARRNKAIFEQNQSQVQRYEKDISIYAEAIKLISLADITIYLSIDCSVSDQYNRANHIIFKPSLETINKINGLRSMITSMGLESIDIEATDCFFMTNDSDVDSDLDIHELNPEQFIELYETDIHKLDPFEINPDEPILRIYKNGIRIILNEGFEGRGVFVYSTLAHI